MKGANMNLWGRGLLLIVLVIPGALSAQPSSEQTPSLPPLDLLVVAPHSDDEAIGCGAVIFNAVEERKRVGVVVITNGDGFPKAAAAVAKKSVSELTPSDFVALTTLRQRHSIQAMSRIGVQREDLMFLGYPDGLLDELYTTDRPVELQSPFTKKTETYGGVVPDYHFRVHGRPAPYLKSSLLGDLVEIIKARKPREIYVTHEMDPPVPGDHAAAFCFVRDAIRTAGWRGTLWMYIVHGQGRLSPSLPMRRMILTAEQVAGKRALIEEYQIGMSPVHDDLAQKFTRSEELFWPIEFH
jgi:LmbE family N-acetylglucosaminyl deacetylase